jgi:hypothetical protein
MLSLTAYSARSGHPFRKIRSSFRRSDQGSERSDEQRGGSGGGVGLGLGFQKMPTNSCHDALGEPTIADAICDRLVHNAHVLSGEELRLCDLACGPCRWAAR